MYISSYIFNQMGLLLAYLTIHIIEYSILQWEN